MSILPQIDLPRLAWLRGNLIRLAYDEPNVCGILQVPSTAMLDPHHYPVYRRHRLRNPTPLNAVIRLFLLQEEVTESAVAAALGPEGPARLVGLGLAEPAGERLRPAVDLYPYRGLWLATDRSDACGEMGGGGYGDAVMALNLSSHVLAQVTMPPAAPSSRTLDLGTGCGLHALLAAKEGGAAVGTDLNPRAIAFARFNAALNDIDGADFRAGDLYAPVRDERFDRILCNPAFILSSRHEYLYRDGGEQGDAMSRRAIVEAPDHLSEGGVAQVVGEFPTIGEEGMEERLTGWLAGRGCDLLLLRFNTTSAEEYATLYAQEPFDQSYADYDRAWASRWESFTRHSIAEIAFGWVTLRRRSARSNWSVARPVSSMEGSIGERLAAFVALKDCLEAPGFAGSLMERRARPAAGMLLVEGRSYDGENWRVEESHASVPLDPFVPELVLSVETRELIERCDGTRTVRQALEPFLTPESDVAALEASAAEAILELLERGILVL